MKKFLMLIICLCFAMISVGCTKTLLESVELSKSSLELIEGEKYHLDYIINPSNADVEEVRWYSLESYIASVDQNGNVTANKPGETVIKVSINNEFVSSCSITVKAKEIKVTSITLSSYSINLKVGEDDYLYVSVYPTNAADKTYTISSSDYNVVSVVGNKLIAKAEGKAVITVRTSSGVSAICNVNVTGSSATSITVSGNTSINLCVGSYESFSYKVYPSGVSQELLLTTNNNHINASYSGGYIYVTGLSVGTSILTIKSKDGKISTTKTITVVENSYESAVTEYINITKTKGKYDAEDAEYNYTAYISSNEILSFIYNVLEDEFYVSHYYVGSDGKNGAITIITIPRIKPLSFDTACMYKGSGEVYGTYHINNSFYRNKPETVTLEEYDGYTSLKSTFSKLAASSTLTLLTRLEEYTKTYCSINYFEGLGF